MEKCEGNHEEVKCRTPQRKSRRGNWAGAFSNPFPDEEENIVSNIQRQITTNRKKCRTSHCKPGQIRTSHAKSRQRKLNSPIFRTNESGQMIGQITTKQRGT